MRISFPNCKVVWGFRTTFWQCSIFPCLSQWLTSIAHALVLQESERMWENFCLRWKELFFYKFFCWQCSNPPSPVQQGSSFSPGQHKVLFAALLHTLLISFCCTWGVFWTPSAQEGWTSAELPAHCCSRQGAVLGPSAGQHTSVALQPLQRKGWKSCSAVFYPLAN